MEFQFASIAFCPLLGIPEKSLALFIPSVIYTHWQDPAQALSSPGWRVRGCVPLNLFSEASL